MIRQRLSLLLTCSIQLTLAQRLISSNVKVAGHIRRV